MYILHSREEHFKEVFNNKVEAESFAKEMAFKKKITIYICEAKNIVKEEITSTRVKKIKEDVEVKEEENKMPELTEIFEPKSMPGITPYIEKVREIFQSGISTEEVKEDVHQVVESFEVKEENKDIPLFGHQPEELVKEIEIENNPELKITTQDLFLVPIGKEETEKFGTANLLKFESKEGLVEILEEISQEVIEEEEELKEIDPEQEFLKELSDVKSKAHFIKILSNTSQEIKDKYKNESQKALDELEERLQQKVLEQKKIGSKKNVDTSGDRALEESRLFKEFSEEIKQAESVQDFKIIVNQEKYKYIDKSTFSSNYEFLKVRKLVELQESDILKDLKDIKSLDDLDALLASYPPAITSKPEIEIEIRDLEFILNESVKNKDLEVVEVKKDSFTLMKEHNTREAIKDVVLTAFEGCNYVEDLISIKENLKERYPDSSKEGWFIQAYFDRAEKVKGKHKKFAETLK